jgi:predicted patatin/cPLA2 family phospholipase
MEDLKKLKVKNWKLAAKYRRTWRELVEKAKTHKGLYWQIMIMICDARKQERKKSALFCDVTQHRVLIMYRRFGTNFVGR